MQGPFLKLRGAGVFVITISLNLERVSVFYYSECSETYLRHWYALFFFFLFSWGHFGKKSQTLPIWKIRSCSFSFLSSKHLTTAPVPWNPTIWNEKGTHEVNISKQTNKYNHNNLKTVRTVITPWSLWDPSFPQGHFKWLCAYNSELG